MQPDTDAPLDEDAQLALARSELFQAGGWFALGLAVLIGSLRMDRLESQHINPYTVPGLLPGLLGLATMLLGTLLALRSWRRGALKAKHAAFEFDPAAARRVALVLSLCAAFGVVLVGHGLPFWLAAAIFVSVAIVTLQRPQRLAAARRLGIRDVLIAIVIGLGAGAAITLVFQQLFLVRLP
ncbi:MAG: tripartite tricarboxylate transporter TctB family protein [Pseudomonadota bacterium]|nr:tripartite tricarboxylate transporter TctB family protein [Pseudomonadota bacterium]